jgi:uncharacterized protein
MKGLILDGGGVFGIGQAHILSKIDINKFDFFVGTSIGAANVGALCFGTEGKDLPDFFHECMPKIFKKNILRCNGLYCPKYSDYELNKSLRYLMGNIDMGDIKKPLFITSVNFHDKKLKVFSNTQENDAFWPLWETVRCSVAAPSYFAPWKGYIDGGVFVSNPSMVAVAAAAKKLKCPLNEIEICSIGTGKFDTYQKYKRMWSIFHWGSWLINALLDGASNTMSEYFVRSLPIKKYFRVDFWGDKSWCLDNVGAMYEAEKLWKNDIEKSIKSIQLFLNS